MKFEHYNDGSGSNQAHEISLAHSIGHQNKAWITISLEAYGPSQKEAIKQAKRILKSLANEINQVTDPAPVKKPRRSKIKHLFSDLLFILFWNFTFYLAAREERRKLKEQKTRYIKLF